ncbi:hypothetical protein [Agromyces albus]|uniref:hypothetical protein n=1 Tax=Agromyces albus TaxID=205332 RepID=UPI0027D89B63|nr:hypothetical protein [Agromyces albus]
MESSVAKPDRTLIVILGVIGVLVIVALIVVFASGEPEPLDESTPEGVVQRYSAAVIEGDEAVAMEYLVPELADSCERTAIGPVDGMRVTLVSTTERDDSADVNVLMVTSYDGGLFGSSEYEEEAVFDLVAADGGWLIESAPWSLSVCAPKVVQ